MVGNILGRWGTRRFNMVVDMEVDMVKDMVEDLEKIVGDMETYYGNGHAGGHGEGFWLET